MENPKNVPGKSAEIYWYTLSEAWSGVNWADLMAAQGAFETFHSIVDALDGV